MIIWYSIMNSVMQLRDKKEFAFATKIVVK